MKSHKQLINSSWIYDVEDMYKPSFEIFCEDSEQVNKLKYLIYNRLNETERRIILAYAEIGNLRDTAKLFRVSVTTIHKKIKNIREKIIKSL